MVYRGKKSPGCIVCRKRKIRCDTQKPSCGQCLKYGSQCGGYRDTTSAQFLDESQHVIFKAQSRSNQGSQSRSATPEVVYSNLAFQKSRLQSVVLRRTSPGPSSILSQPLEELAVNYFYNSFVSPSFLTFLPPKAAILQASLLYQEAILCTSIASFANRFGTIKDVLEARRRYAKALLLTNEALRDPVRIHDDVTIIAVYLLGFFENIDCDSFERESSWQNHVRGCCALIRLRGQNWLSTPENRALFKQFRFFIMTCCMWEHAPVPSYILDGCRYIEQFMNEAELIGSRLLWIVAEVCDLRAKVKDESLMNNVQICRYARKIAHDLATWADTAQNSLEPVWRYEVLNDTSLKNPRLWRNVWHKYNDFPANMAYSTYRATQVIIMLLLRDRLEQIDAVATFQERKRLTEAQSGLLDEICAGIPWRLGWPSEHGVTGLPQAITPTIGGYGAQWPLKFVGFALLKAIKQRRDCCDFVASESMIYQNADDDRNPIIVAGRRDRLKQLQWIASRMNHISDDLGIHQGTVHARVFEDGCRMIDQRWPAPTNQ